MKPLGGDRPEYLFDWFATNTRWAANLAYDLDPTIEQRFTAELDWIRQHRGTVSDEQYEGARRLASRRYSAEILRLYRRHCPVELRYSFASARASDALRRRLFGYDEDSAA